MTAAVATMPRTVSRARADELIPARPASTAQLRLGNDAFRPALEAVAILEAAHGNLANPAAAGLHALANLAAALVSKAEESGEADDLKEASHSLDGALAVVSLVNTHLDDPLIFAAETLLELSKAIVDAKLEEAS